ncbi:MAG: esterase [Rhodospirillaceae bacterium]|nr:esterase [Rhodospirillaceae bacterium]|tara:strand:+ start:1739 stop:2620 length:882 start_codon:yes stop_codon:yes gene_type:complete
MPQETTRDKIFLDYTQEELDWQYDHSKRFPDTSLFQKERGDASLAAQKKVKGLLNIPYGNDKREVLDIFPAENTKAPVIVFMHGGAWTRGSKEGYSFPAAEFVPRGVTWVATEFTNVPEGTLSNQVRQNRDAVAWVYNNAEAYGWDRDKIYIAGHSSGAHMCAMSLVTDWKQLYDLPRDLIKGAIAISGMYDLEAVYLSYRNTYLNLSQKDWRENSPIFHIPLVSDTPLLIGCAEHDTAEFHRQPEDFIKAWQSAGHSGELIKLMDRHHFTGSMCFGEVEHPLFNKICEMIGV